MLNIGLIGTGLQAKRRLESIKENQYCSIKCIAGIVESELNELSNNYSAIPYTDWKELVNSAEIDAVIICTPPHLHYEISLAALSNGKHVLCEKPLTLNSTDAKKLYDLAAKENLVLKCGFNHRFHPAMLKAYEIIKSGEIGKVITARALYGICGRDGCENEWRSDTSCVSGGQLMEQGVHMVDLLRWYMGEFESVSADVSTQVFPIAPLEDTAVVLLHGKDGVTATIHSSITQWRNRFRLELCGTNGYLEVTGLGGSYDMEQLHIGKREPSSPFTELIIDYRGKDKSWGNELNNFFNAINSNEAIIGDALDGSIANYIIEKAYEAAKKKERIILEEYAK